MNDQREAPAVALTPARGREDWARLRELTLEYIAVQKSRSRGSSSRDEGRQPDAPG